MKIFAPEIYPSIANPAKEVSEAFDTMVTLAESVALPLSPVQVIV